MGGSIWLFKLCLVVVLWAHHMVHAGSPRITHSDYVYQLTDVNNETCLYASFRMNFKIYYTTNSSENSTMSRYLKVPPVQNLSNISGYCTNATSLLVLHWAHGNSLQMTFLRKRHRWYIQQVGLQFNFSKENFNLTEEGGLQMFLTSKGDFFNRTFRNDEYFYCKHCKTYKFYFRNESVCEDNCTEPCFSWTTDDNKTKTECSDLEMEKSVIFIGNPSKATKRLCLEDYIAFLEMLVPVIVGGILGLLLLLIFIAYIIAYIRRRRREAKAQYEPVRNY